MTESQIREMTRLAYAHDAVNLSQGYPDFAPPEALRQAAARAVLDGPNQYTITWGIPELLDAIAESYRTRFAPEFDWIVPESHVTTTCGVTEGILASVFAIAEAGDEVIIVEPAHENYAPAVKFAGATPKFVSLKPPSYRLTMDMLEAAFGPNVRALIFNNPHNPSGRVFSAAELRTVAEFCKRHDLVAITDEIYDRILYDGARHVPLATLPGMQERTITVSGFGKTYAVTGWRLGFAVAPEPWSTALRTVHDFTTICAPAPLQHAAKAALALPESFYAEQLRDYHERRSLMLEGLGEAGFDAQAPEGAYYILAGYERWGFEGSASEFAAWLTRNVGVAVVAGSSFYEDADYGERLVRFAFAKRTETLEEANRRLRDGFGRRGTR